MKIKMRSDDVGMLEVNDWHKINDWLAELREDGPAELTDDGHAESASDRPWPETIAAAPPDGRALAEATARTGAYPRTGARPFAAARPFAGARPFARPRTGARPPMGARPPIAARPPIEITEEAAIGNHLRMPVMWCEMGSCISRHADPAASGEADVRARAIEAGWRVDALGRLTCPQCQQTAPGFRTSLPVALWNRDDAMTTVAHIAGVHDDGAAAESHGDYPRPASTQPADRPQETGRHRRAR